MQHFLRISANLSAASAESTTPDILAARVEYDVNAYDVATFTIPASVQGVTQFKKVELIRAENGSEETVFSGFVYSCTYSKDTIEVTCRGEKALLEKKLVLNDLTYTAQPASDVLAGLLAQWNSAYGDVFTADSSISTPVTKEFKRGDSLYGAIEELAGLVGAVWDCRNGSVRMATSLGTDRTVPGEGYAEVSFDGLDPYACTAQEVTAETYDTATNVLIATDGNTKSTLTDANSRAAFGPLGEYKQFRAGSLTTQAQQYLDSKKTEQRIVRAKVANALGYVDAGDTVRLSIRNVNAYMDIEAAVIVNQKTLSIENGTEVVTLGLSETYAYVDALSKKLNQQSDQLLLKSL